MPFLHCTDMEDILDAEISEKEKPKIWLKFVGGLRLVFAGLFIYILFIENNLFQLMNSFEGNAEFIGALFGLSFYFAFFYYNIRQGISQLLGKFILSKFLIGLSIFMYLIFISAFIYRSWNIILHPVFDLYFFRVIGLIIILAILLIDDFRIRIKIP